MSHPRPAASLALRAGFAALLLAAAAPAEPPAPPAGLIPGPDGATVADLDRAIAETISRPQYSWRSVRPAPPEPEEGAPGLIARFFAQLREWVDRALHALRRLIEAIEEWLEGLFPSDVRRDSPTGWETPVRLLLLALLAAVGGLLGWFLWRNLRARSGAAAPLAEALPAERLIEDDSARPDQLPADEWLELARSLAEQGDLRLALRAMFLGCLATLASRGCVTVARHKSNRDYLREFERRARDRPAATAALTANVALLERVWYGRHAASADAYEAFVGNQRAVLAAAQPAGNGGAP